MNLALHDANKVRQVFSKYKFFQQRNESGYTVNCSTEEFVQNGGGMCRDFVAQQAMMLKRMHHPVDFDSVFFLPTDVVGMWQKKEVMHSFTAIYGVDGSVYVPESTLDPMIGVWYFPTFTDCITAMRIAMKHSVNDHFKILTYKGDDPDLVGLNRAETVDYILRNGLPMEIKPDDCGIVYEGLRVGG